MENTGGWNKGQVGVNAIDPDCIVARDTVEPVTRRMNSLDDKLRSIEDRSRLQCFGFTHPNPAAGSFAEAGTSVILNVKSSDSAEQLFSAAYSRGEFMRKLAE